MVNVLISIIALSSLIATLYILPIKFFKDLRFFERFALFLYGFELILAYFLLRDTTASYHLLISFTNFVGQYMPGIFSLREITRYPEGMACFLAFTYIFIFLKIFILTGWMLKDKLGNYRHAVISPFHREKIGSLEFIEDGAGGKVRTQSIKKKSWFSIVFFTFALWLIAVGFIWSIKIDDGIATLGGGAEVNQGRYSNVSYMMNQSFIHAWIVWCLIYTTLAAFFAAAALMTLKDWGLFFYLQGMKLVHFIKGEDING